MGAYGFIRLAPAALSPDAVARFLPGLSVLAVIGIVYGGLMALVQKDMKSLVAYSSVSHMGLVMLAVFALNVEAMEGRPLPDAQPRAEHGGAVPLRRHPL